MSLEEIADVLEDSADDLAAMRGLLAAQLDGLERHAARVQQLTHRIRGLLGQLDTASMPGPDQFMTTLEMISVYEAAFTTEEQEQLARRRAELGSEAIEEAKKVWAGLVGQLLRHVQEDTPVDDPRVQVLAGRWDALGNRFHAEGAAGERTKAAARTMWRENSEEIGRSLPQPADRIRDLVSYLERARQARQ
ncbi:TipAS antibiotic-recognition domain-containing protein [Streptomyces sp. NPDC060035]|uniref:TipAS antibiotic-recognition domain-containing protein n=1 Tax=Streptomyces sp. NPDC060035 TaxID=3347044 RepID=UPI003680497F